MPRRGRGGGPWWLLDLYTVWSMVLSGEHNRTERLSSEQNPAQSQDRRNISLVNLNLLYLIRADENGVIILFGNLWCYDGLIWLPYQTQTEEKLSVVHASSWSENVLLFMGLRHVSPDVFCCCLYSPSFPCCQAEDWSLLVAAILLNWSESSSHRPRARP